MHLMRRKQAELALLYSLVEMYPDKRPSRLRGLLLKLRKIVSPTMLNIVGFTDSDLSRIIHDIYTWGKITGWLKTPKRLGRLVSFCVDMVENSPVQYKPEILDLLIKISCHMDDGQELSVEENDAGVVAAKAWQELYKKG